MIRMGLIPLAPTVPAGPPTMGAGAGALPPPRVPSLLPVATAAPDAAGSSPASSCAGRAPRSLTCTTLLMLPRESASVCAARSITQQPSTTYLKRWVPGARPCRAGQGRGKQRQRQRQLSCPPTSSLQSESGVKPCSCCR